MKPVPLPWMLAAAVLVTGLFPAEPLAQETDLTRAYKREFAVLESEKQALKTRRDAIRAQNQRNIRAAEANLSNLQARTLALRKQADALEETLRNAEPETDSAEGDALLEQLFTRAAESLAKTGRNLPDPPKTLDSPEATAHIKTLFSKAPDLLASGGEVRREPGTFFLQDGTQVTGELLKVGLVATYGTSDRGQGALAPAGDGRLRIWEQDTSSTAAALFAGKRPEAVQIFLHEGLEKAIEAPEEKTALSIVQSGGTIAWVIVGLGIAALLLILARLLILIWAGVGASRLPARVEALVAQERDKEAAALCQTSKGPTAVVLSAALRALGEDSEAQERIIAEAVLRITPSIERFGSAITVFAAVAPLLGLLGTVTGMISTFDIITEHGTGDPKLLSGGISEALVTTELGLIVAIPTLLLGSLLTARAEGLLGGLERSALRVLNATDAPPPPAEHPASPEVDLSPQAALAATAGIVGD